LSEGEDMEPNSIGILDKVARCAAKDLQRRDRSLVSQMRRLISGRANHTHTGRPHLSLVNPPSLGDIDLLALLDVVSVTPHIVCLDSSSLRWSDKQNDPTNSPIRLSRLISRLCSDALDRYSGRQEHRIVKSTDPLPDVDLIALVSLMPCMGYLGLCGPNRVVDFTSTASPHDVSLAWIVESGETATSTHFNLQNVTAIDPEVLKAAVSTFWPTTHADRDQREQEALVITGSNVEGTWLV
jgi:hypothetical protein